MTRTKKLSPRIDKRQLEQKKLVIEQLRKIPIVQVAVEKIGIARATYYRWIEDDSAFAEKSAAAILEGTSYVNDMAESQLVSLIRDQNFPALSFWLRHRHKNYTDKVEVTGAIKHERVLSEEEKTEIRHALKLAVGLVTHNHAPTQPVLPPLDQNKETAAETTLI